MKTAIALALGIVPFVSTLSQDGCDGGENGTSEQKVLIIGIDGLRPDALKEADTPNLDALIADGLFSDRAQAGNTTVSGPGWSNILCGVWEDKHGVTDNSFEGEHYADYPSLFTRIQEESPDLYTAAITSWNALPEYLTTDADYNFYRSYTLNGDEAVREESVRMLTEESPDLLFVYFSDVDSTGHNSGFDPNNPFYIDEIESVDAQIGDILDALYARETFDDEDWLILVTTDHGGSGFAHSGETEVERTVFYIANGADVVGGSTFPRPPGQVDVAVTALDHLGLAVDESWDVDGEVVLAPQEVPFPYYGPNLLINSDFEEDEPSETGDNFAIAGWRDSTSVIAASYEAGLSQTEASAPSEAGAAYALGGDHSPRASITQTIYIDELADDVDAPMVLWRLDGEAGGFEAETDSAEITLHFRDGDGFELDTREILGAGAADRDNTTGMVPLTATGLVPAGTREIDVYVEFISEDAYNHAAVDNLVLVLTTTEAG